MGLDPISTQFRLDNALIYALFVRVGGRIGGISGGSVPVLPRTTPARAPTTDGSRWQALLGDESA